METKVVNFLKKIQMSLFWNMGSIKMDLKKKEIEKQNVSILHWKDQNYELSKIRWSKLHLHLFEIVCNFAFRNFIFIIDN